MQKNTTEHEKEETQKNSNEVMDSDLIARYRTIHGNDWQVVLLKTLLTDDYLAQYTLKTINGMRGGGKSSQEKGKDDHAER